MPPDHRTNPRIKAFEKAARIYCAMAEMDADAKVETPHPTLQGVEIQVPQWEFVAEQMGGLSMMLVAMKQAGETIPSVQ